MPNSSPTSAGPVFRLRRSRRVRPRSLLLHVTLLLALSATVACGLAVLLWLGLGTPDLRKGLSTAERLDALKIVLTVVAGIGAVVALTVAYRKQRDGELAEHREDAKSYADRFGKAADQLGHTEHVVRESV